MKFFARRRDADSFERFTESIEAHRRTMAALSPGYGHEELVRTQRLRRAHENGLSDGSIVELYPRADETQFPDYLTSPKVNISREVSVEFISNPETTPESGDVV